MGESFGVELSAEPGSRAAKVCIHPGSGTLFLFDSPLLAKSVEVQQRERFVDVAVGNRSITLMPPTDIQPGERFSVQVRFADDVPPTSATFELVAHPSWAAKQVSVVHPPVGVKNCPEEPRTGGHGPGLTGLLAEGVIAQAGTGVEAKDLSKENTCPTGQVISWGRIFSYLSTTSRKQAGQPLLRLALAVELSNHGMTAWMPTRAALGRAGQRAKELSVWTARPLPPGTSRHWVMMETEQTEDEARQVYTLDIWDDSGSRRVSIGHVAFP
ncbi:hypothetical protein CYFUS_008261 [Cystobacter fuscus]|uniref:Uncharacterized protein n=2 Tax=Cystobacter fuscus TaxID=43 RepID=A0A250JH23_9BACT|nr:hypothetical protein CYFUS_008261 [Cystobacter fuscus]